MFEIIGDLTDGFSTGDDAELAPKGDNRGCLSRKRPSG